MENIKKIIALFVLIFLMESSTCFASSFSLDRSIGMLPGISGNGNLLKDLDLPFPEEGRAMSQKPLNTQLSGGKKGRYNRPNQGGSNRQDTSNQNRGEDSTWGKKQGSRRNPNNMGNSGNDGNRNPRDDKNSKIFSELLAEEIPEELYKSVYITKEDLLLICSRAKVDIKTLKGLYQNNQDKYKILVNRIALEVYNSKEGSTFDKLSELYDDKRALTDLASSTNNRRQSKLLVIWARFAVNFNELFDFDILSDLLLTNKQKQELEDSTISVTTGEEKDSYDYVFVDPENFVHVLCPLVGG